MDLDGTKTRTVDGTTYYPSHPETIDVKITNYCDTGCMFCHESSTIAGKHGDLHKLIEQLSRLPKNVELAIGGGNPLSHPDINDFLEKAKDLGFICNITIRDQHVDVDRIAKWQESKMVYGVGISCSNNPDRYSLENVVYHVICGINHVGVMERLEKENVLVLGYKTYGFGKSFFSDSVSQNIKQWYQQIPRYVGRGPTKVTSFDNLAIEQLNIKRLFTGDGWEKFYMGDDFTASMYMDAVKQEHAPTSRSDVRISWAERNVLEFFAGRGSIDGV